MTIKLSIYAAFFFLLAIVFSVNRNKRWAFIEISDCHSKVRLHKHESKSNLDVSRYFNQDCNSRYLCFSKIEGMATKC